jgi:hypothetical protein
MKHVFLPKGRTKLRVKIKGLDNEWTNLPTPYSEGEEALAEDFRKKTQNQIDAERELLAEAGGELPADAITFRLYCTRWSREHLAKKEISSRKTDVGRVRNHALPVLGPKRLRDVTPKDIAKLVMDLKNATEEDGTPTHAPRTVRHIFEITRRVFADAVADCLISANPCVLKQRVLPQKLDKNPTWRPTALFSESELERLLSEPDLAEDRRVQYALEALAMLRHGEMAALQSPRDQQELQPRAPCR